MLDYIESLFGELEVARSIIQTKGIREQLRLSLVAQHHRSNLRPLLNELGLREFLLPLKGYGEGSPNGLDEQEYAAALDTISEELRTLRSVLDKPDWVRT